MNTSDRKTGSGRGAVVRTTSGRLTVPVIRAMLAVGGAAGLIAAPAAALELGEIRIDSALGQPLRASIAYVPSPNEALSSFCITLTSDAVNGLQPLAKATISVDGRRIYLRGHIPINEPLLAMRITADCPGSANFARDYMLMIDPAGPARPNVTEPVASAAAKPVNGARTTAAARPQLLPRRVAHVVDESPAVSAPENATEAPVSSAYEGYNPSVEPALERKSAEPALVTYDDDTAVLGSGAVNEVETVNKVVTNGSMPAAQMVDAHERGDTVDYATPRVSSFGVADDPATTIPDTGFSNSVSAGEDAKTGLTVATRSDSQADGSTPGEPWWWLKWLGGSGLLLLPGLLIFSRKIRDRFGRDDADASLPIQEADDDITQEAEIPPELDVEIDLACPIDQMAGLDAHLDSDIDPDNIAVLDLDLGAAMDLRASSDLDLVEDFGFSPARADATPVDLELSERAAAEPDVQPTDTIPPQIRDPNAVPHGEVLPDENDEDDDESQYDLSMITDATKQAHGETDGTAKDLMAVPLSFGTEDDNEDAYTLNKETDYEVLEQDYEDELTATQALNADVAKAALGLAERMDIDDVFDATAEVLTSETEVEPATIDTKTLAG